MPAKKRVNLESLITKKELEQFNDIRVKELPKKIEKLGQGRFGQVFLFKFKDGRRYAGKRPKINLFNNSPEDERQMKKHLLSALGEIRILHLLNHERIIKISGFYLDQDQMIIFMERMRGSVKDEINEKRNLSEIVAMHYFTQAAEGLVYLHSQKPKAIIHRDIKCENLLLTAQYNIKLADFGLAIDLAVTSSSRTDLSTAPSSIAGTYLFMAPEVIRTIKTSEAYGRKSDVWSLSCTLVEMINGKPPYKEVPFMEFVDRSSDISQNPLKYSGNILLPTASYAIRALLNSLFITDCQLRPNAETVLNLAHIATVIIKNTLSSASTLQKIGFVFFPGRGVPQSDGEAVKLFRNAAEQGNAVGQNNLGNMYFHGRGVHQSDEEAVKWYREAAEQEDTAGQSNLGFMYEKGRGVPQSNEEAVKWYRKAAEQGDAGGQRNLGLLYQNGRGVPKSDEEAVKWYRKAAEQGDAIGQRGLGFMYEYGRCVPQSDEEAVKWYKKAAEQGDAEGQRGLGFMYFYGRGVLQSDEEAVKWCRKAAEQGDAGGQRNLGLLYQNGRGVPQSDVEAVKWYRKAAEQGDAIGQSNLGFMYNKGRGVPQSDEEAVKWYRKAVEQGNASAESNLRNLQKKRQGFIDSLWPFNK